MNKKEDYYVNRHSCFILSYHLVLVTKYRRPIIDGAIRELIYETASAVLIERDCVIHEINGEYDHVHILFDAGPEINLLDLIRVIKTKTARFVRSQYYDVISKYYWKPVFWTDSYFIATVGEKSRDAVSRYIQNQGIKSKNLSGSD